MLNEPGAGSYQAPKSIQGVNVWNNQNISLTSPAGDDKNLSEMREVTHAVCGHTADREVRGSTLERQRQVDVMSKGLCLECYHAELNRVAAKAAEEAGLPELQGTDKQIVWALSTRNKLVDEMEGLRTIMSDELGEAEFIAVYSAMKAQTSASWWIERSDSSTESVIREIRQLTSKKLTADQVRKALGLLAPKRHTRIPE